MSTRCSRGVIPSARRLCAVAGQTQALVATATCSLVAVPPSLPACSARWNTIVHECGHFYDFVLSRSAPSSYFLTDALTLTCARGDTTSRGGDTYARSRLNDDTYSVMRPPCSGDGCDFYADTYLDGDPDDDTFDGGDQGFSVLFEEAVQYVNSVATAWAFVDQFEAGRSTSARDGILTFLWYIERYLHQARLEFPSAYERITDPCWRNAILTLWGRAWLYLEATAGMPRVGHRRRRDSSARDRPGAACGDSASP